MKKNGTVFKNLRLEKNLSRSELAKRSNLSCTTIWQMEHDYAQLKCSQLELFASIFGKPIMELFVDSTIRISMENEEIRTLLLKIEDRDLQIAKLKATIAEIEAGRRRD